MTIVYVLLALAACLLVVLLSFWAGGAIVLGLLRSLVKTVKWIFTGAKEEKGGER